MNSLTLPTVVLPVGFLAWTITNLVRLIRYLEVTDKSPRADGQICTKLLPSPPYLALYLAKIILNLQISHVKTMALKNILVVGATGQQAGALISALLARETQQFNIFALTRNPSSPPALRLAVKGVNIIQGDTTDPSTIFTQIPSLYGVFLVTLPTSNEREQALPFIDAAAAAGVQHFIFTSADRGGPVKSESDPTNIPHFGAKMAIEQHLKKVTAENSEGRMKWTILRPTSFMDNLSPGFVGKIIATTFKQMGSTRISLISTKDIGRAAALAFEKPESYSGRVLTLTGDLVTFEEMNTTFKDETGAYLPMTFEIVVNGLQWAISDLGLSMKYFREGGYDYEMDTQLSKELGLRDFRAWLREESKFEALKKSCALGASLKKHAIIN